MSGQKLRAARSRSTRAPMAAEEGAFRPRRLVPRVAVFALLGLVVAAGCGGSEPTDSASPAVPSTNQATTTEADMSDPAHPSPTDPASADGAPEGSDAMFPDGLRGVRYCEVLLLSQGDGGNYTARVFNSLGLNDCPQADWEALDPATIAAERGAVAAVLNGPRYWTLDTIVQLTEQERVIDRFGEIDMFLAATVDLGDEIPAMGGYAERSVARETVFRYAPGSEIYLLHDAEGRAFVMQAYSLAVDAGQSFDTLPALVDRLALPEGWTFSVRTIDFRLDLQSTEGVATVVQDELQNTYQRIDDITLDSLTPLQQEALAR